MNNYNELLENLRRDVIRLQEEGNSVIEIAKELNIGIDWVSSIVKDNEFYDEDKKVYEAIINDTEMRIDKKEDLIEKTNLSMVQINASLERLVKSHKLSEAKLWKRRILPPIDKSFYDKKEKEIFDMYIHGYRVDYISYIFKLNPDTLRRTMTTRRQKKGVYTRAALKESGSTTLGRNRILMEMIHFINYHFDDLSVHMDERNKQVFRRNLDTLTEDLVEGYTAKAKEESDNGD